MHGVRFIFRILFNLIIVLLSISVLRRLLGAEPLTFSYLLDCLQNIDVDFSSTVGQFARIAADFTFDNPSVWSAISQFFTGLYDILMLPINLVIDFFAFVLSVARFLIHLVGFDFLGVG